MYSGLTVLSLFLSQDALFFLKDFFSNLASLVNPYLPVDPAAEGEHFLESLSAYVQRDGKNKPRLIRVIYTWFNFIILSV